MRKRGNTLYSRRVLSYDDQPENSPLEDDPVLGEIPCRRSASDIQDYSSMFSEFGTLCNEITKEKVFTGDIDPETRRKSKSLYTVPSSFSYERDLIMEELYGNENFKLQKCFKSMIIGIKGVGKHTFIDTLFNKDQNENIVAKQSFNFLSKTVETTEMIKRYKFWIKDTLKKDDKLSHLFNLYYKNVSTFIMIFNPNDKGSLESIEEELKLIFRTVSKEEFNGILVSNSKRGLVSNQQISEEELRQFIQTYGIKHHFDGRFDPSNSLEILNAIEI
jgi:hypothetical protein